GRDERARRAFDKRQLVGNELEDVVAGFAEEQVAGLTVESAGEDVVARSAEDPLFTRATNQHVVAFPTQDHVATEDLGSARQISARSCPKVQDVAAGRADTRQQLVAASRRAGDLEPVFSFPESGQANRPI